MYKGIIIMQALEGTALTFQALKAGKPYRQQCKIVFSILVLANEGL